MHGGYMIVVGADGSVTSREVAEKEIREMLV
jgi:hypothetical protein